MFIVRSLAILSFFSSLWLLSIASEQGNKKMYRQDLEALGVTYLDHLEYAIDKNAIPVITRADLSAAEIKNLDDYIDCIQRKEEALWYMQYINDTIGYGIFADADIKDGQFIGEYTGIVLNSNMLVSIPYFSMKYVWNINTPERYPDFTNILYVDGRKKGNFTRSINHSFDPNVKALCIFEDKEWHLIYIACKAIAKDQQLLVDYGQGYWRNSSPVELQ